jgi:hypothetical protein
MPMTWARTLIKARADANMASAGSSATVPSTELTESRAAIRATTKWMVAGAGAVAAVIVAGLQLAKLPPSTEGRAIALFGFGLAIMGVGLVIVQAANVLVVGYAHLGELADLRVAAVQKQAGATVNLKPLAGIPLDQFVKSMDTELKILSQGAAYDVSNLYKQLMNSYNIMDALRDGKRRTSGKYYTSADMLLLLENVDALEVAAQRLISFSNQRVAEASFRQLKARVIQGGALLAVGAALFAVASTWAHPLTVTKPTQVVVYPAHGTRVFGKNCPTTSLHGVAIGGDWQAPVVTIPSYPGCASTRLTITRNIGIVVPMTNQKGG